MPNRMIKESIKTSDSINSLSWFAEVMFYRLLLTVDDYGRMDGRPVVLRNTLFPTRDDVTTEAIKKGLEELLKSEVIFEYNVDNKSYICFPNFSEYQRLRAKNPRYPAPSDDLSDMCQSYDGHMSDTCLLEEEVEVEVEEEVEDKRNKKETGVSCCETEGLVVRDSHLEGSNSGNEITRGESITEKDSATRGESVNVLKYLNSSIHSNYRNCDSTLRLIRARLKEGYTFNDCKTVIDKKCSEWLGTDMAKFLRPSTLFAKGHFEEYLNAPVSVKQSYQRKVPMPEYWSQPQKEETMSEEEMRNLLKLQEEMSK